jgi:hypothetical protein
LCPALTCPSCLSYQQDLERAYYPGLVENLAADQLVRELHLLRRPRVLSNQAQRDWLQQLADLEKTCRERPSFGAAFTAFLCAAAGGAQWTR